MNNDLNFSPRGIELNGIYLSEVAKQIRYTASALQKKAAYKKLNESTQIKYSEGVYKFFIDIASKVNSGLYSTDIGNEVMNILSMQQGIAGGAGSWTTLNNLDDNAFDALEAFYKNPQNSGNILLPNGKTVKMKEVAYDFEFMNARDANNKLRNLGIWQYSFVSPENIADKVEARRYSTKSGLIGWNSNDDIARHTKSVIEKLRKGKYSALTDEEKAIYDFGAHYGEAVRREGLRMENGRFIPNALSDDKAKSYMRLENLEAFYDSMIEMGEKQGVHEFEHNGRKVRIGGGLWQFAQDFKASFFDKSYDHVIGTTYNGLRAEISVMQTMLRNHAELGLAFEHLGITGSHMKKIINLDVMELYNANAQRKNDFAFTHEITASEAESLGSLDRVHAGLFRNLFQDEAHHNTTVDSIQTHRVAHHEDYYNEIFKKAIEDSRSLRSNRNISEIRNAQNIYLQMSDIAPYLQDSTISFTYEGNPTAPGRTGNIFFNNRTVVSLNGSAVDLKYDSLYANSPVQKNGIYKLNPRNIRILDANDKIVVNAKEAMGDIGQNASRFVVFSMENVNGMQTTVVQPLEVFADAMAKQTVLGYDTSNGFVSKTSAEFGNVGYYMDKSGKRVNVNGHNMPEIFNSLKELRINERINDRIMRGSGISEISRAAALNRLHQEIIKSGQNVSREELTNAYRSAVMDGRHGDLQKYINGLNGGILSEEAWKFGFGLRGDNLSLANASTWTIPYRKLSKDYIGYGNGWMEQMLYLSGEMAANPDSAQSMMANLARKIIEASPDSYGERKLVGQYAVNNWLQSIDSSEREGFFGKGASRFRDGNSVTLFAHKFIEGGRKRGDLPGGMVNMTFNVGDPSYKIWNSIVSARGFDPSNLGYGAADNVYASWFNSIISENDFEGGVLHGYSKWANGDMLSGSEMSKLYTELYRLQAPQGEHQLAAARTVSVLNKIKQLQQRIAQNPDIGENMSNPTSLVNGTGFSLGMDGFANAEERLDYSVRNAKTRAQGRLSTIGKALLSNEYVNNFSGEIKSGDALAAILGNTSTNRNLYWESISGIGEVKEAQLRNLYEAQRASLVTYSGSIYNSITRNGGTLFRENGQIFVQFGSGGAKDITSSLARLEIDGSVMQYRIGDVAYAADGVLNFDGQFFNYKSRLRQATEKNLLAYKLHEAKLLDKDLAETTAHILSVQAGNIRTTPVGAGTMREMRNNIAVYAKNVYEDERSRQRLVSYLSDLNVGGREQGYINDFLTELRKYENSSSDYTSQSFENAFTRLIHSGIISPEVNIGQSMFRLGSNLSQKKVGSSGYMSLVSLENGGSMFDDVGEGRNYIQEHYLNFNQAVVDENNAYFTSDLTGREKLFRDRYTLKTQEQLVAEKAKKAVAGTDTGIVTNNEFSVRNWEAKTKDIDDAIAAALKNKDITEEEAARISSLLNTYEGGAFVSGRLADTLGLDAGTKKTAIEMKEVAEETEKATSFMFQKNSGRLELRYNQGYVVGRNEELYKVHSLFGNELSGPQAKHVSQVTQKLFTLSGIEVTEAQANNAIYSKLAKDIMRGSPKLTWDQALQEAQRGATELELKRTADSLFVRKMVSENLEAIENIKIMASKEKHETAVGIDAFGNLKKINLNAFNVLNESNEFKGLAKLLGRNSVAEMKVGATLFRDIANLDFSNPVWSANGINFSSDAIKAFRTKAIAATGSAENWKKAMFASRYYSSDLIKNVLAGGADVVSYNLSDALKHFSYSVDIEDTYNELVKRHGKSDAFEIIKSVFVSQSAEPVILDKKTGHIVLTEAGRAGNGLGIDANKLETIRTNLGLSKTSFASSGTGKILRDIGISVADDAYDFVSAVSMGNREINSLSNEIFSNKNLVELRKLKGENALNLSVFGSMLDKDGNFLEKYQHMSIWDKDTVHSAIAKNFFGIQNGALGNEELLDEAKAARLTDSQKTAYNAIRQALDEDAPVSRELVEKIDYWNSGNNSLKLYRALESDPTSVETRAKELGFTEIHAKDVHTSFRNGRAYAENTSNAGWIWNKDTVVDISNGSQEIQNLFKGKGINSTMFIGHGEFKYTPNTEAVPLPGYQALAAKMINDSNELAGLQEKIARSGASGKHNELIHARDHLLNRMQKTQEDYVKALNNNFVKHNKEGIAEELNKRRISIGANRTKTVVYDVNSLRGGVFHSNEFEKFTFQGKSLASLYKNGNDVSFVVASAADLDRYGYNEKYFRNLASLEGRTGEDAWMQVRSKWLEQATTEGVEAFVNRSPSDYFHSTGTTRLYFSEHQNSGIVKTDSITAMLMKNDADGDTILSMMIGSKTKDNTFIDLNSYRQLKASNSLEELRSKLGESVVSDLENLMVKHEQGMLMNIADRARYKNTEGLSFAKQYINASSDAERVNILKAYNKEIEKRAYNEGAKNIIYAHARELSSTSEANALIDFWNSSAVEIESALKSAVHNGVTVEDINLENAANNWKTLKDADRMEVARQLLNSKEARGYMVEGQAEKIAAGMRSFDSLMEPLFENILKGNQEHVGEIDNPLFVLDTLADNFKNRRNMSDEELRAFEATQHWRELIKEGFLSSKNTEADKAGEFAKLFKQNIENFIRSNGTDTKSMESLINLTGEYGKFKVIRRYGEEAANEAARMKEIAKTALGYHRQVLANVSQNLRGAGTNDYMRYIFGEADTAIGISRDLLNGTGSSAFNLVKSAMLAQDGTANRNYQQMFRSIERRIRTDAENTASATRNGNLANFSRTLRGLTANLPSSNGGNNLAIKAVGIAAGIMAAGYAGGNPSRAAGSEAQEMPQPAPQQTMQPQLIDPRIGNITGGPTQGYVINLNARSDDPNMSSQYIGRMIGNAMTNTYSNNSINVNLNVKERHNEISSSDLANYLMQAL